MPAWLGEGPLPGRRLHFVSSHGGRGEGAIGGSGVLRVPPGNKFPETPPGWCVPTPQQSLVWETGSLSVRLKLQNS